MSHSAICRLASTAKDAVMAFLLASAGTVAGTMVAWRLVGHLLGAEGYKAGLSSAHDPKYFNVTACKFLFI